MNLLTLQRGLASAPTGSATPSTPRPADLPAGTSQQAPLGAFRVPGMVPVVPQTAGHLAWAAAVTMLVGWREHHAVDLVSAVGRYGSDWVMRVRENQPVTSAELPHLLAVTGLVQESGSSFSPEQLEGALRQAGPVWLATAGQALFSEHALVVVGTHRTSAGLVFDAIDPAGGRLLQGSLYRLLIDLHGSQRTAAAPEVALIHWPNDTSLSVPGRSDLAAATALLASPLTVESAAQRGWGDCGAPGSPDAQRYERANIVAITAGGVRLRVHREVAPLFQHFCDRLVALGYRLDERADDWGYASRFIHGTQVMSNHAWGLAIDINALDNPVSNDGQVHTNLPQAALDLARSIPLRWGGDYHGNFKDPMHFEFMGTPAEASAAVATLTRSLASDAGTSGVSAQSLSALSHACDLGDGAPGAGQAASEVLARVHRLAGGDAASPVGLLRAQVVRETQVSRGLDDPMGGLDAVVVDAVVRVCADTTQEPSTLLALWRKEGGTAHGLGPRTFAASSEAHAKALFRSEFLHRALGLDNCVHSIAHAGQDNEIPLTDAVADAHQQVFTRRVAALVSGGQLARDISAAIDAELSVHAEGAGSYTVTATVRFLRLTLLLLDASFTASARAAATRLQATTVSPAIGYLCYNLGTGGFDHFAASATQHARETSAPTLEAWALHTVPQPHQWDQARRNAIRFAFFAKSYEHLFDGLSTLGRATAAAPQVPAAPPRGAPATAQALGAPEDDAFAAAALSLSGLTGATKAELALWCEHNATPVLGTPVPGLLPHVAQRFQAALVAAGFASLDRRSMISSVYRRNAGNHGFGVAIDLAAGTSPYLIGEAGERVLDAQLRGAYDRATRLVRGTPSWIPRLKDSSARGSGRHTYTRGTPDGGSRSPVSFDHPPTDTGGWYDALASDSAALQAYFAMLSADDSDPAWAVVPSVPDVAWLAAHAPGLSGDRTALIAALRKQMAWDYCLLTGKGAGSAGLPASRGTAYPTVVDVPPGGTWSGDPTTVPRFHYTTGPAGHQTTHVADAPFTHAGPEHGFMQSIARELCVQMRRAGFRWGAIDFGPESGDVMHFDLPWTSPPPLPVEWAPVPMPVPLPI